MPTHDPALLMPEAIRAALGLPARFDPAVSRAAATCPFLDEIGEGCCSASKCKPGGRRAGQNVRVLDCYLCQEAHYVQCPESQPA